MHSMGSLHPTSFDECTPKHNVSNVGQERGLLGPPYVLSLVGTPNIQHTHIQYILSPNIFFDVRIFASCSSTFGIDDVDILLTLSLIKIIIPPYFLSH